MEKILFITNKIPFYRKHLYENVGRKYNFTIAHTGELVNSYSFQEIILNYKKYGPIINYIDNINYEDYDVVIINDNIRLLNLYKLLFRPRRKYKVVLFGIGVSASYKRKYDKNKFVGYLKSKLLKKADAAIFYDDYPAIKYSSMGVDPNKLFVTYNTVVSENESILPKRERDSILFIGALYKQKKIFDLLEAYKKCREKTINLPHLKIIGDGPEKERIEDYLIENDLTAKITLLGQLVEEEEVGCHFKKALFCVSPGQAGLSVQKSFSYGVPFVTTNYPISGGEFTSIIDDVTGFFYDGTVDGLQKKMEEILNKPNLDEIYQNCWTYYTRFRSPENWVKQFVKAIEYSLQKDELLKVGENVVSVKE